MKKVLSTVAALLIMGSVAFAQNVKKTTRTKMTKTETKATTHMKKDGTPDKRYKDSKTTTTTVKHMKKDGTPDMRYKENKMMKTKKTETKTMK